MHCQLVSSFYSIVNLSKKFHTFKDAIISCSDMSLFRLAHGSSDYLGIRHDVLKNKKSNPQTVVLSEGSIAFLSLW